MTSDLEPPPDRAQSHPHPDEPSSGILHNEDGGPTGHDDPEAQKGQTQHSFGFWMVMVSLCLAAFLSALDISVITTALPTIIREIGGEGQYVWIANTYVITSTAVQPFFGQLADIFGRRFITLGAISLFLLGSGLSGGAINVGMLLFGRCIQGLGSGGIMMLVDLIVCDLVALRERPKYIGVIMSTSGVAVAIGPLIGGSIVENISWRWVFYINLPIGGIALILNILYLRTKHKKSPTWMHALARIDYLGNTLFIGSSVALLLGLVMGGQLFPWRSWQIILPIVLGGVGMGAFVFYESTPLCKEPTIPLELFGNRTSAIAYCLTFLSAMLLQWVAYYLPIYFQAVQLSSPIRSGVQILPLNAVVVPCTIAAGIIISVTGKYLPVHIASFAFMSLAFGLFSRMNDHTGTAEWVLLQMVAAAGTGLTMNSPLTALQASLPDSYNASATATYAFLRSFAFVWGITIPAIVFNGQVANNVGRITNHPKLQASLGSGGALGFTTKYFLESLNAENRAQVVSIFSDALETSWYVGMAFALLGFVLCFGEKQVELRTELDTQYGLEDEKRTEKTEKTAQTAGSEGAHRDS